MKRLALILILGFAVSENVFAQEFVREASDYFAERPMEKVILHMDKPYYAPGDRIWYAAYVMNYQSGFPSTLSEMMYLTFINPQGQLIHQQRIPLTNGLGDGNFTIPDTLSSGYYTIHAYTSWMRNFDESLIYTRPVPVVSYADQITDAPLLEVEFFIEGGRLLKNKLGNIAFQANKRKSFQGIVIDQAGNTVREITSDKNGFGVLNLVMLKEYQLHLIDGTDTLVYSLPGAESEGTVLLAEAINNGNLRLTAFNSDDYEGKPGSIIIQQHGRVVVSLEAEFKNGGFIARVPASQLPTGLLEIFLFDEEEQVLNHRLFYQKGTPKPLTISGSNRVTTRGEISLDLSYSGHATVSVTVTPNRYFNVRNDLRLETMLLPGTTVSENLSDTDVNDRLIKGNVRAYSWEEIPANEPFDPAFPLEKRNVFQVKGTITGLKNSKDQPHVITVEDENGYELYVDNIEAGNFSFALPAFSGNRHVFLKPYGITKKQSIEYSFIPPVSTRVQGWQTPPFTPEQLEYSKIVKENAVIQQLYQLDYSRYIALNGEKPISFSLLKAPEKVIHLSDYIPLPTMEVISIEILEGVRIKDNRDGTFEIVMRKFDRESGAFMEYSKERPLMFIDGVPVDDPEFIGAMNPLDVESISMSYGLYTLNGLEFHGVLAINTVEGGSGLREDYNQGIYEITGYSLPAAFNIPAFTSLDPDMRTTLFWQSGIGLNPGEKKAIKFRASDETGYYTVQVFGLSATGDPVYETFQLEVTPQAK